MTKSCRVCKVNPITVAYDIKEMIQRYLSVGWYVLMRSQQGFVLALGFNKFSNKNVRQKHVLFDEILRLDHSGLLETERHMSFFIQSEDKFQVIE